MQREIYSADDVARHVLMARDLASRAVNELRTGAEDTGASGSMAAALAAINAAGSAIEASDCTEAAREFRSALDASGLAHADAGRADGAWPPPEDVVLLCDLIEQAMRAIDGAAHRMENSPSRHASFGAIRTPRSERMT